MADVVKLRTAFRRRIAERLMAGLTFQRVANAVSVLNQAERQEVVKALVEKRDNVVGDILRRAVLANLEAQAAIDAEALITAATLSLDDVEKVL